MVNVCEGGRCVRRKKADCSVSPAVRGIGRGGRIEIDLQPGDARRIAVSVAAVVGAASGQIFALRRLRELPDFGKLHSTFGGARRMHRKRAPRRGRASIVDGPVNDLAFAGMLANVLGSDGIAVVDRDDAGTINSGTESGCADALDP